MIVVVTSSVLLSRLESVILEATVAVFVITTPLAHITVPLIVRVVDSQLVKYVEYVKVPSETVASGDEET